MKFIVSFYHILMLKPFKSTIINKLYIYRSNNKLHAGNLSFNKSSYDYIYSYFTHSNLHISISSLNLTTPINSMRTGLPILSTPQQPRL
jgi:hypothetical protein